jgi:hypothetical protein
MLVGKDIFVDFEIKSYAYSTFKDYVVDYLANNPNITEDDIDFSYLPGGLNLFGLFNTYRSELFSYAIKNLNFSELFDGEYVEDYYDFVHIIVEEGFRNIIFEVLGKD